MSKFTRIAEINPQTNPLFQRLREREGFETLNEAGLNDFLASPGLKFLIFADDPNTRKETMDIIVIGPEIRRSMGDAVESAWCTDVTEGRALAARWGVRKLPALALFRGNVFLGAAEGLDSWDGYLAKLAQIASRTEAPKRSVAILPQRSDDESCIC